MALPASQQHVPAAPGEGQVVGAQLRQVQIKDLLGYSNLSLLDDVLLMATAQRQAWKLLHYSFSRCLLSGSVSDTYRR